MGHGYGLCDFCFEVTDMSLEGKTWMIRAHHQPQGAWFDACMDCCDRVREALEIYPENTKIFEKMDKDKNDDDFDAQFYPTKEFMELANEAIKEYRIHLEDIEHQVSAVRKEYNKRRRQLKDEDREKKRQKGEKVTPN